MSYTLGEASKAVGKSKATLSKAIKSGKISAKKNEDGSFSIEAVELHRVYPPVSETPKSEQNETPVNTETSSENIELRVKLDAALQRIQDLEKDKEEWREQARVLALTPPKKEKKSWLGKFFPG